MLKMVSISKGSVAVESVESTWMLKSPSTSNRDGDMAESCVTNSDRSGSGLGLGSGYGKG